MSDIIREESCDGVARAIQPYEYEEEIRKLNKKVEILQKENSELKLVVKSLSYLLANDLY